MNLLFVDCAPFVGGAQESLLTLMAELARMNHNVHLACAATPLATRAADANISVHPFTCRHWTATSMGALAFLVDKLKNKGTFKKLLETVNPQLVHLNSVRSALLFPHTSIPTIIHDRDLKIPAFVPKHLAKNHPNVIAISNAVAEKWRLHGIQPTVIHNPFPISEWRQFNSVASKEDGSQRTSNVLLVADFVPWKRHERFIRAVAELKKLLPNVTAVIKGRTRNPQGERLLRQLKGLAESLDLHQTIVFDTDNVSALPTIAKAQVVVSTACNEPFGRTIVEALALGKPVVALNSGGIGDILHDCPAATLLPDNADHADVANAMRQWLNYPNRDSIADNARKTASAFDVSRIVPIVLETYETIITQSR